MLFEMYETYSEKQSPDTYNGLPILDRDDLMNAVEDAAGSELRKLVEKYLDKVERQASEKVSEAIDESETDSETAVTLYQNIQTLTETLEDINGDMAGQMLAKRLNREKLERIYSRYCKLWRDFTR